MGPDGRLLWINSRVETITGYTVDECHAMSDFPLSLVAPQDWKKVREAIAGALHGTTGDDFVFRARRKDGSEFWASADWRPIYGSDQAYLGLRLSVHDVTGGRRRRTSCPRRCASWRRPTRSRRSTWCWRATSGRA